MIRSPSPQLVPFKRHRFGKQRPSEFKREKCIISDGQVKVMVMVRVIKITRAPMGPPKPAKLPKPPKPKVVVIPQPKDEVVVKKLRKLVANMPR